jgi:hypothetical protein
MDVFGQTKENAERIDAVAGGFKGSRFVAAESGLSESVEKIERLGI